MGSFDVLLDNERTRLDVFVEEYRSALEVTLNGVTVQQARTRLVPSSTTLLGLLEHVTWMQRVWFEECVGGTSRQELGLVSNPGSPSSSPRTTPSPPPPRPTARPARRLARQSPNCRATSS
jgi:hypothetical protein